MQCIGNTRKTMEDSGLVPIHSASDLQAGSAHLQTSERKAKVKWPGISNSTAWREVDNDLGKKVRFMHERQYYQQTGRYQSDYLCIWLWEVWCY